MLTVTGSIVAALPISQFQRFAHQFLLESFQTRSALVFKAGQWEKQSALDVEESGTVLTVFAQSLNFHQLEGMITGLADTVTLGSFSRHPLCNIYGDTVLRAHVEVNDADRLKERLAAVSQAFHIEVGVQHHQPKLAEPGLLVMDMDSTVIQIECIDEIAVLAGRGDEVAKVTAKAMRGELDFNQSLITRVACLKGVELAKLEQIRDSLPLTPGIQLLVKELKMRNWRLAIASGGFTFFADYLCQRLGLDDAISNTLAVENGVLTGHVGEAIVNAQVKAQAITELAEQYAIEPAQTIAAGDGANDLLMMDAAALGVACHAKPVVNDKADVAIRHTGLHSLLYFLEV